MTPATSPAFAMLAVRQVLLVRWVGPTKVAEVEDMRQASRDLGVRYPHGIAHLNLVDTADAETRELDDPTREAILRLLRDREIPLRLSSVVFPQSGFQAALVRAILGGLLLMSRTPAHVRVHSSVRAGAEWIGAGFRGLRGDEPPPVEELVTAMEGLRQKESA